MLFNLNKTLQNMLPNFQNESQKLLQFLDQYKVAQTDFMKQLDNRLKENNEIITQRLAEIFGEGGFFVDLPSLITRLDSTTQTLQRLSTGLPSKDEIQEQNRSLKLIGANVQLISSHLTRPSWMKRAGLKLSSIVKKMKVIHL